MSGETASLEARIKMLSSQYDLILAEEGTVEYEGIAYSVYDGSLPEEIQKPAVKALNTELADLLLELVDCRNRLAQLQGYDSYLEYGFGKYNSDDVTPKDIADLVNNIVPYLNSLNKLSKITYAGAAYDDYEGMFDRADEFLGDISTDMSDLLDYLLRNGLIFCEHEKEMYGRAYTAKLPSHNSALIYIGNIPNMYETSFIHEFGHAVNHTLSPPGTRSMDIDEIHSHGLQALALAKPEEDIEKRKATMSLSHPLPNNLIGVCCTTYLESALYFGKVTTAEEIEEYFGQMSEFFGRPSYTWSEDRHLFTDPFYSSAYITALSTALEIAAMSIDDWDAAADAYMKVQTSGMRNYGEAMEYAGIPNVFEGDNAVDAMDRIVRYYLEVLPRLYPEVFTEDV